LPFAFRQALTSIETVPLLTLPAKAPRLVSKETGKYFIGV
jgi:hypothetical protein